MSKKSRRDHRRARMKASQANDGRGVSWRHRTLATIKKYLETNGLFVIQEPEDPPLILDFSFYPPGEVTYRDDQGDAACMLAINASEDGSVVSINSPNVWCVRDCPHRASVFEALVRLAPRCRLVRFHHIPESDAIGLFVLLPTNDREVLGDSIMAGICGILMAIMHADSVIRRAMANGEVVPSSRPDYGAEPSPEELDRIENDLIAGLAVEEAEKWRPIREQFAAEFEIPKEPGEPMLVANAVIVHRGRVLCLTPTLPADFERVIHQCMSRVEADLQKEWDSLGLGVRRRSG